ncbi:hypothetical protein B9Z07_10670 [Burkholderia cenocepacia]|uniref:HTH araC/xylS-type domain-containing protein n=2 Tax=Burkholderia cepacia complex TaxID=87882 RepID=A0AAD0NC43_9BURK|nr:hypothetical protein B9Z07_10670 [Burkholderia cenocepacia]
MFWSTEWTSTGCTRSCCAEFCGEPCPCDGRAENYSAAIATGMRFADCHLTKDRIMAGHQIVKSRLDSDDAGEIASFIKSGYADNQFTPLSASGSSCAMIGSAWDGVAIYDVIQEKPFSLSWEDSRSNYLFMHCKQAGPTFSSQGKSVQCGANDVMPISISGKSALVNKQERGDRTSVIIDAATLTSFVAQWIGRPVVMPLAFDPRPLSQETAVQWNAATDCLQQMMLMDPVPGIAAQALIEHMLKMVLTGHASNYSEILSSDRYVNEQLVRSALNMIATDPLQWRTLGMVAHELACATDGLEKGIKRLTGRSAIEIFHEARLDCVNRALLKEDGMGFIETLHVYGFSLSERFIFDYIRRFGESPGATYRRNPNVEDVISRASVERDAMCEQAINEYIDASLGERISLSDLARHLEMTEQTTITAFKESFSRTPMQYVIERRLERARHLLCHTSNSIISIALECGFGTQSYLTSTMKKYYGVTPRRMRINHERK